MLQEICGGKQMIVELESKIKNALAGKNYGSNKLIVTTTIQGEVIVEPYVEFDNSEEVIALETEIEELEQKVKDKDAEIAELVEKLEEKE